MEVKLFNYKSSFNKIDHPTLFHSILSIPFKLSMGKQSAVQCTGNGMINNNYIYTQRKKNQQNKQSAFANRSYNKIGISFSARMDPSLVLITTPSMI